MASILSIDKVYKSVRKEKRYIFTITAETHPPRPPRKNVVKQLEIDATRIFFTSHSGDIWHIYCTNLDFFGTISFREEVHGEYYPKNIAKTEFGKQIIELILEHSDELEESS